MSVHCASTHGYLCTNARIYLCKYQYAWICVYVCMDFGASTLGYLCTLCMDICWCSMLGYVCTYAWIFAYYVRAYVSESAFNIQLIIKRKNLKIAFVLLRYFFCFTTATIDRCSNSCRYNRNECVPELRGY